jgi:TM2 domain-containing membrane protein YozV
MKSQKVAFLLQFFLSFGVAQFYVGQTTSGTIKLCINTFICYFGCMYCCCAYFKEAGDEQTMSSKVSGLFFVLLLTLFFVWWFVDVCFFGFNLVKDGNDHDLYPW